MLLNPLYQAGYSKVGMMALNCARQSWFLSVCGS